MISGAPDTSWIIQPNGVLLVNNRKKRTHMVYYPQAAIWDLISRHPVDAVVQKMTFITGLDKTSAESMVRSSIDEWLELGFLKWEAWHG